MSNDQLPSPRDHAAAPAPVKNVLAPQQLESARAFPAAAASSPFGEWRRYALAAARFKWLVAGATVLATAAAIGASMMLDPDYVARAMVWIQVPAHPARDQGPIWSGQLPISTGWTDLLRTNVVLEEVVRQGRLYVEPRVPSDSDIFAGFQAPGQIRAGDYRLEVDQTGSGFTLYDGHKNALDRGAAGEAIGRSLGFVWTPAPEQLRPKRRVDFTVTQPYEAARRLGKHLRTSLDVDGNFLRLELAGSDPAEITTVVNAVAERFVSAAADLKRQNLTELTRILGTQLQQARQDLANSETALKQFRVSAVTDYAEGTAQITPNLQYPRDPVFAGLLDMKVSREELRRDRQAIERLLPQGAAGTDSDVAVDALTMIGAVQKSTELSEALRDLTAKKVELRSLQARYTDANAVVRRIADEVTTLERQTIPRLALELTHEMALREQELDTRVATASGGLRRIPPLALEEARLSREVTLREQTVTNLGARYEEARLAEVSAIPDVRLIDPAVEPSEPARGWASLLIALGLLGGLGAGIAGAVVLDQSDRRVQYPEHVTDVLGLSILGAVPHLERSGNGGTAAPRLEALEALRAIRLNLGHAHGAGPTLVTVTSPGRSDGKSFVASNIALSFADAGYRTLLIDADVRRGVLHRTLKLGRRPGLVDLLSGEGTLPQALQATPYRTLTFLASGTRSQTGPILVSSAALPRLMAELRPHYDAIIVDSPPLAAGVDAIALGAATGTILFVLRTGVSDRQLAQAKLEVLAHLPIRVLGAVLNDVRGRRYRYYSYYLEGYEARDETQAAARLMRAPE